MRKILISLVLIAFPMIMHCQTTVDVEAEKAAIIAVIEGWTEAEYAADYDLQATYIAHNDEVVQLGIGKRYVYYGHGIDQYYEFWDWGKEVNYPPSTNKVENTDYQIRVFPECAWATYTEKWYNSEGEHLYDIISTRILEKIEGEWKLMYIGYLSISDYDPEEINPTAEKMIEIMMETNPEYLGQ